MNPDILWVDGHAEIQLDAVWKQLFDVEPLHFLQLE